jgi:hypothetical protein
MKIFGHEPTLVIQGVTAVITLLATFNLHWITPQQAALIGVALAAVSGLLNALAVRPISPAIFTSLIGAIAAVAVGYGVQGITAERVGLVQATVVVALGLITRAQVTPEHDKAAIAPAAGAVR